MSRLALARRAVRPSKPARVLLVGLPSALMTALDLAERWASRTVVVDAASGACLDLAAMSDFDVVHWPPFHTVGPLVEVLDDVERGEAVVIDPLSSWWDGEGGLRAMGHQGSWDDVRSGVGQLTRAITTCRGHVIATSRARLRSHVEVIDGLEVSRLIPDDLGVADDMAAAFSVVARIAGSGAITVESSLVPPVGIGRHEPDELGGLYAEWMAAGAPVASPDEVDDIRAPITQLPDERAQRAAEAKVRASFGDPRHLPHDHLAEAREFIARITQEAS